MLLKEKKITITDIKNKKLIQPIVPIVAITAYDALFARLFDDYVDIILIGDSLNLSFNGKKDTLSASTEIMMYHTKAVCAGSKRAFKVTDMPFASYTDEKMAIKNASKFFRQTDVDAVKLEGGLRVTKTIKRLCEEGISVMGHIGLMPQQVRFEGGYKVKGRISDDENRLIEEAMAIEEAGAFSMVIEGVIESVAEKVAKSVKIPVIGIGSGVNVDGQILVWSDMLGLFEEFKPKFAKHYIDGSNLVREAVQKYAEEVKNRAFPSEEYKYKI
ncbi:3-methyl-2-oxobutanoate hydroxymethyltransferase [Campylobacter sp. RM16192]|uniref:3-methyl-2-oxobutanoate hydroxymethyltransferase n=1 Tax=Campylobacter sp. RM16192 TaxID=1660080 RepID=UPI001452041E|nr:3-methyl-2-oxobutanoate hydroxymethyltransferase [Campylobacter sp. RM16192]QCD52157.1 3-methyl-2-oxobutanoate hydroxymethyltransferase [Campylobacter sp. RM16192]